MIKINKIYNTHNLPNIIFALIKNGTNYQNRLIMS